MKTSIFPVFLQRFFISFLPVLLLLNSAYANGHVTTVSVQDSYAQIETIVGNGKPGVNGNSGDGGYATNASFGILTGLALDEEGNLYVGDSTFGVIRRIDTYGVVSTVVGTGIPGDNGDQHTALYTQIKYITGMSFDSQGRFVYSDIGNSVIRRLDHDSIIRTVANVFGGYFVQIQNDFIIVPTSIENRLEYRKFSNGDSSLLAGVGLTGFGGDGDYATNAVLNDPIAVIVDRNRNIIFSDRMNHRIRIIDTNNIIATLVGNSSITNSGSFYGKFNGDGLNALKTSLNCPAGLLLDSKGRLLFCDSKNHRIRRLNLDGTISTIVGNGIAGYSGNNDYATNASVNSPHVIVFDKAGNLLIADTQNYCVRKTHFYYKIHTESEHIAQIKLNPDLPYYEQGSQIQVTVQPAAGYLFQAWSDGSSAPHRTFVITNSFELKFTMVENVKEYSLLSISQTEAGTLLLGLIGNTNQPYVIETSGNMSAWHPYVTNSTDASGKFVLDLSVVNEGMKFFRSRKKMEPASVTIPATIALNNYDPPSPLFFQTISTLLPLGYSIQLLGGPVGGVLFPVFLAALPQQTIFSLTSPGFFDAGIGIVPGVEGGSLAQFQLLIWKDGTNYATAMQKGESSIFQQTTGSWDPEAVPPIPPTGPSLEIQKPAIIQMNLLTNPPTENPCPQRLVWISPGVFTMGSPTTEKDREGDEGPLTQVTISEGFWMGKYEVSQEEYLAVMKTNPSYFTGNLKRPVEQVSWIDATNYCSQLTQQERAAGKLPRGFIYRLPTEAEWEYACRAGTTTRFCYGDDLNYTLLGDYAWYCDNSGTATRPPGVSYFYNYDGKYHTTNPGGQKLPNSWGLYDMHGNIWEWCLDWHYAALPGKSVIDPKGPSSGIHKVFRGGNWFHYNTHCRSAFRFSYDKPDFKYFYIGFRVVLAKEEQILPIAISRQPESMTAVNGSSVTLWIEAKGRPDLCYQWLKDRIVIPGRTNSTLVLTNVTRIDEGTYSVVVSSGADFVVSENAILVVRSNTLVPSMVRIPPGSFVMGSPLTEKERNGTESPQTHVTISKEFWIGKNEVTQREYFALIGNNPSTFTGDLNRPVESLKWQEAKNYCLQLTELERVAGRVPTGYEYRLPTEAEWEYACRAGTTTRFSYGDDLDYAQLGNYAWFMVNSSNSTHGVGQKLPNPWGLYDIHGNVWEMCLDYWSLSYSGGNVTDPKGANSGIGRSARGGSYKYYGLDCRSAIRYTYYPDDRNSQVGFRVVLAPKL